VNPLKANVYRRRDPKCVYCRRTDPKPDVTLQAGVAGTVAGTRFRVKYAHKACLDLVQAEENRRAKMAHDRFMKQAKALEERLNLTREARR